MKSRGFFQTPQDIIEEYNGCSVPQYTAYPCSRIHTHGAPFEIENDSTLIS